MEKCAEEEGKKWTIRPNVTYEIATLCVSEIRTIYAHILSY